ncbi:type I methionyl aminopeptidase [Pseudokordiimonas caeni]|uniref:type I methionyl aminopeptidase n=1 Tax=Pseudokordiimonas caeni TaxID=2997908 RepID=UPI0028119C1E|nr:type I methionyl aminopeptidase [Pseudokordiimonas caeni]
MTVDHDDDLKGLREIGGICRDVLNAMAAAIRPGITPRELDILGGEMLKAAGARSAPMLAYDFPGFTCISVGDAVAHGIPNDRPLQAGELINIDVSAEKNGYFGDTGASFGVGAIDPALQRLLDITKKTQRKAMLAAKAGARINEIGRVVSGEAKTAGYKIVQGLNGHGVGGWIHEEPTVANEYFAHDRGILKEGMVLTIEPFLATHSRDYYEDDDGWTLRLSSGGHGAQFEHTFVVTKGAPIVLTA